jgi:hypothetical protein
MKITVEHLPHRDSLSEATVPAALPADGETQFAFFFMESETSRRPHFQGSGYANKLWPDAR